MASFLERINTEILVCDGALGTMLTGGQTPDICLEELNLKEDWRILNAHKQYIEAGAQIIETNTFGANEISLAHGLEDKVEEINKAAVRIARQAVQDKNIYVAGAVGPANHNGSLDVYKRQIGALAEAGADLIIIETISSVESALNAIKAAKSESKLPIIAQIACNADFTTKSGVDAETFFRILNDSCADVVGLNCKIGPEEMYHVAEQARKWTTKPLSLQPNCGKVTFSEQEFYASTDSFERYAKKFIELGARIIGGCCGTTPKQTRIIARTVNANQKPATKIEVIDTKPLQDIIIDSTLEKMLANNKPFPIVEIDPPHTGKSADTAIASAKELYDAGVKVFTIADNPGALPRLDNIAFASLLLKEIPDAEIILHLACRDLSVITAESRISAIEALGIHNVLAITGDPPAKGDYNKSIAVHNFQSISLLRHLSKRNSGLNGVGKKIKQTHIYTGCAFDCGKFHSEKHRLKTKHLAGAGFTLTQIISDVQTIEALASFYAEAKDKIVAEPFYIIPGIYWFKSTAAMEYLQDVMRVKISQESLKKMQDCKTEEEQKAYGLQLAKDLITASKQHFPAVYIIPPSKKPETIIPLLKETGLV